MPSLTLPPAITRVMAADDLVQKVFEEYGGLDSREKTEVGRYAAHLIALLEEISA